MIHNTYEWCEANSYKPITLISDVNANYLSESKLGRRDVAGRHGGMMGDLLGEEARPPRVLELQLVCLPEQRVERLVGSSVSRAGVARHREGRHQADPVTPIRTIAGSV